MTYRWADSQSGNGPAQWGSQWRSLISCLELKVVFRLNRLIVGEECWVVWESGIGLRILGLELEY